MAKLTKVAAVARLERIAQVGADDPEVAHSDADAVLLAYVPAEVREAYEAVAEACRWWAYA